jgi:tetratricopeptide (TPR) repeat protein
MRPLAIATAVSLLTACGPARSAVRTPTPNDIPRLEATLQRDTADVATRIQLGAAYRAADRLEDARMHLERAVAAAPAHPAAVGFLGLTYEELGEVTQARHLYERHLASGEAGPIEQELRRRLDLLARQELIANARRLARQERSASPPQPRTVAVFPFLYVGSDPQYRPLGRALAELLVTDLAQTSRLTVLERLEVQALLDELALAESDIVDPATAARSGRLLSAERVVQGTIALDPDALELEAAVVGTGGEAATVPVEVPDLQQLFDAEKRLALALYESMGVELTIAERERVESRPTANIEALLAFGEGLEAEDAGDFDAAATHFARAAQIDPGFAAAAAGSERTSALHEAQTGGAERIAEQASSALQSEGGAAIDAGPPLPPSLDALMDASADPMRRDAAAEALGLEGVRLRSVLQIIFIRP